MAGAGVEENWREGGFCVATAEGTESPWMDGPAFGPWIPTALASYEPLGTLLAATMQIYMCIYLYIYMYTLINIILLRRDNYTHEAIVKALASYLPMETGPPYAGRRYGRPAFHNALLSCRLSMEAAAPTEKPPEYGVVKLQ